MPRYILLIEYAGTRYSGWQIQRNARTVQGELERAVRSALSPRPGFELYGAGRTDAGVHALGQVAHLDIDAELPPDTIRYRLNDELPADINVLAVDRVSHRFHARHDAVARRYLYQIATRRTAFGKPFVWWIKEPLDVTEMRRAADLFLGMKDFRSFASEDPDATVSTLVFLDELSVTEDPPLLLVRIGGSHFLWKMARRIVGVLVEVGRGGLSLSETASFLAGPSAEPARLTAPPSGLFLERVFYTGEQRDVPTRRIEAVPGLAGSKGSSGSGSGSMASRSIRKVSVRPVKG